MTTACKLASRRVILPDGPPRPATLTVADGLIERVAEKIDAGAEDLGELLLAPGLVDLHGDAFERQIMPRPGVMVEPGIGLLDTDRQLVANGITTAFHGLTWSWEPGLRSAATGRAVIGWLEQEKARLLGEHRIHLRFENHNVEGAAEVADLIAGGRIGLLAFNDHTPKMASDAHLPSGNIGSAYRAGVPVAEFNALALAAHARGPQVPATLARLADLARAKGIPLLAHDCASPAAWDEASALGCTVAEFPLDLVTARAARAGRGFVVMGAPNVLRGRSHMGWAAALDLVAAHACDVLASDYFYPALLQAPFRIVERLGHPLADAWRLVSRGPALAAGFNDRGELAEGRRADMVAVGTPAGQPPAVLSTWRAGRRVFGPAPAGS